MTRTSRRRSFPLIRAALILFIVLLAIYIPLKIHIAKSGATVTAIPDGTSLSIFATSDLKGYREPCG
jgi:hypothetical protein